MESAIDVEAFPGGEGKLTGGQVSDCTGNISTRAPSPDGREAILDQLVILLLDGGCHVAGNNPGANLVDPDAVVGEAVGQEPCHHLHGALGHAVVGTIGGRGISGDGGDVDNRATGDRCGLDLAEHLASGLLGKEKWALEIGGKDTFPVVRGEVEKIHATGRSDAGVIDQQVETSEFLVHMGQ